MRAMALRLARLAAYAAFTLPIMPVQGVLVLLSLPFQRRLPRLYHRWSSRILGFRVIAKGEISRRRPTLFVSNHISYVDIEVLGALLEASFIARADVARWPFFGWLAKLQRTVFVDRRPRNTAEQRDAIRRRLDAGDDLILFPEGTSSDGTRVLPYKSALLSVAEYEGPAGPLLVQPVSIAYLRLDGIPLGRFYRPYVAWYGDMDLLPHLWAMLGLGVIAAEVTFHPPVTLAAFGSRKALAEHCWRVSAAGLASALAGRPQQWPDAVPATPAREAAQ
jgi:1-acyl-sn-glycerol-3-phosphate acyltransferase